MRLILFVLTCLQISVGQAKIEVLFHPHDPTLEKIAEWILQAQGEINIAMYNMDTTDRSPVVQALKSPSVQERLRQGSLKIHLIFEGYGTSAENRQKMDEIESWGPDVRFLGKSVKVHHKFAVIDPATSTARVVSGSANWSMSSYKNYNENILFFEEESEATARFQTEFLRLWQIAKEHGIKRGSDVSEVPAALNRSDLEIFFNSPARLKMPLEEPAVLTDQVVRWLDQAHSEVQIATTRIRLVPVLDAVVRAAQRGVQLQILISQDDFADLGRRARWLMAHPNIQLRVKFYNLKVSNYMSYQMHNKFMIIDRAAVLTGSFNWSESSENKHIENLVEMTGAAGAEVLPDFLTEFQSLWEMNRHNLPDFQIKLNGQKAEGEVPSCGFEPTALTVKEVRAILKLGAKCGG